VTWKFNQFPADGAYIVELISRNHLCHRWYKTIVAASTLHSVTIVLQQSDGVFYYSQNVMKYDSKIKTKQSKIILNELDLRKIVVHAKSVGDWLYGSVSHLLCSSQEHTH